VIDTYESLKECKDVSGICSWYNSFLNILQLISYLVNFEYDKKSIKVKQIEKTQAHVAM